MENLILFHEQSFQQQKQLIHDLRTTRTRSLAQKWVKKKNKAVTKKKVTAKKRKAKQQSLNNVSQDTLTALLKSKGLI